MSDKVPEWAYADADALLAQQPLTYARNNPSRRAIASALLSAYRSGVEDSARVASGQPYLERYRTWPWWKMPDGVGNRANESEIVRHSDDIAAAIRRLGEAE